MILLISGCLSCISIASLIFLRQMLSSLASNVMFGHDVVTFIGCLAPVDLLVSPAKVGCLLYCCQNWSCETKLLFLTADSIIASTLQELTGSSPPEKNWRGIVIAILVIIMVLSMIVVAIIVITPSEYQVVDVALT